MCGCLGLCYSLDSVSAQVAEVVVELLTLCLIQDEIWELKIAFMLFFIVGLYILPAVVFLEIVQHFIKLEQVLNFSGRCFFFQKSDDFLCDELFA